MTTMADPCLVDIDELTDKVHAIFHKSGLTNANAAALTLVLIAGERDGCKSHGIYRIEGALRTIKVGKVRPDAVPRILPSDGSAIVRVDAEGGFANAAFELGVPALVELAERYGIASLVINDCCHF